MLWMTVVLDLKGVAGPGNKGSLEIADAHQEGELFNSSACMNQGTSEAGPEQESPWTAAGEAVAETALGGGFRQAWFVLKQVCWVPTHRKKYRV